MEVSCPAESLEAGPQLRDRPLCRWHTLDSGENTASDPEETKPSQKNLRKLSHDSLSVCVGEDDQSDSSQAQPIEMTSTVSTPSQTTESPPSNELSPSQELNGTSDTSSGHLQSLNGEFEDSTDSQPAREDTGESSPPRPTELNIPNFSDEEKEIETPPDSCAETNPGGGLD